VLELSSTPLWDLFSLVSYARQEKTAVLEASNGETISYGALRVSAERFSEQLQARRVIAVAMIGEPTLAALPMILAVAHSGATLIPLSDSEPDARLIDILRSLPVDSLVFSNRPLADFEADTFFSEIIPRFFAYRCQSRSRQISSERPYLVTHSSGSTGRPKPVALGQGTKIRRTKQSIALFEVSDADTVLSVSPFHHSLGQRHFFVAMLTGATLIRAHPFRTELWLQAVERYRPTFSIPVATHLKLLGNSLLSCPQLLDSFRCLVTSSAPAEPEFKRRILDRARFDFWEIYGMTETACATAARYAPGSDTGHLGKAIPGTTVRIVGPAPIGEIEVCSDVACDGYWGDQERWIKAHTSDGFFKSGDLGQFDNDGNLRYVGRTNESFQSAGLIIYPADIERVILEFPGVVDCVAYGLTDALLGNTVGISVAAGSDIDRRALAAHFRTRLAKHMWPSKIDIRDQLPRLSSGKVDRQSFLG
jgi:long-chain acyl-CoA synthetase